jgi:hydrogenase maturation factor
MNLRPINLKAVLLHFESMQGQPGMKSLIRYARSKNLRIGLFTEHDRDSMVNEEDYLISLGISDNDFILTADQLRKPHPESTVVALAAKALQLDPANIMLVSSRQADIAPPSRMEAICVHLDTDSGAQSKPGICDYVISSIDQLITVIRMGVPLPSGKLPNDLLREFLNEFDFTDPALIIKPGIGEDTAALDVSDENVIVLKSDPITFATDSIGQYAVLINANDIATSGAKPRWLLTTLLFPQGITPSEIRHVVNELKHFCKRWEITLCGGHTEITDAVNRPVVTGMMAGTVVRAKLIDKRNMKAGDKVLFTKGVAVEGTAIIAREFGDRLKEQGMSTDEINTCRDFLSSISIIPEANLAAQFKETSAMHDVTEGGLATALEELSIAGGHQIRIEIDTIPTFSQTRKICSLVGINPLGLIGSGSLLICCRDNAHRKIMAAIRDAGIEVACIGEVLAKGHGIRARKNKKRADWPCFEVDEITKLF